ncbi:uncharacterized protein ACBR49_020626 [Aulostomus maculatus]
MPSIQSLTMTYDALNENGTFSEGDTITGKVTLVLIKEIVAESFFVKAKGDAQVRWTKKRGNHTYTYSSHRRYFKLKQFFTPENATETVIPRGTHVYDFSFNIPQTSMPSTFAGAHGKVVYMIEAKLSRSWKMTRTVEKPIQFLSKSTPDLRPLMSRQHGTKDKEMGFFSKGNVHLEASIEKAVYRPGEVITALAKINNSSSSEMRPKFSLIQNVEYRANNSTRRDTSVVEKASHDIVTPRTQKDVRQSIKIPHNLQRSINNCDILTVEYFFKVYLDISFAFDPEILFPLVIVHHELDAGPHLGASGGPSTSHVSPSFVPLNSFTVPPRSGMYRYPEVQQYSAAPPAYPDHHRMYGGPPRAYAARPRGGYSSPASAQYRPYASPYSSATSSPVLHPPPTAPMYSPPSFAQATHPSPSAPPLSNINRSSAPIMDTDFLAQTDEAPPAYSLLFPSSCAENSDPKFHTEFDGRGGVRPDDAICMSITAVKAEGGGLSMTLGRTVCSSFDYNRTRKSKSERWSCSKAHGATRSTASRVKSAGVGGGVEDRTSGREMSPIKDLEVTVEELNEEGTFSEGDAVSGTVSFTLTKECKVKSLLVKLKGDAHVHWTEGTGDDKKSYSAHRRYFKVKEFLIPENGKGNVLPQGMHRFKFMLKIPDGDMPSSFQGMHGKIQYLVEVKLSRNWRWPSSAEAELKFVSRSLAQLGATTCPQAGSVTKGEVLMSATVNKKVCSPGDTLSVVADINNSSSKKMKPKFSLQQTVVYRATTSRKTSKQKLCKMIGDTIEPNSRETVSCQLQIPEHTHYTLLNCEILSVEYTLKVYLDISFAFDPEVLFPVVIRPPHFASQWNSDFQGPPAGAMGAPSYNDFSSSAFPPGAQFGTPGAYGYPAPGPAPGGYQSQFQQPAAAYGFQSAAFPPSSVQSQTPSAPPLFQQEAPPSYPSLFQPPQQ